jgi:TonB family protein
MSKKIPALLAFVALALLQLQPPSAAAAGRVGARPARAQSTAATEATWERYTYPDEEFSVELPGMPFVFETTRSVGRMEQESLRVFGVYAGGAVFFVNSYDRPRSRESLDYFAKYHLGGRGLTPAAGEVILDGFAGREYRMDYSYGSPQVSLRGGARVFRTKKHAYVVQAFSEEGGHEQEVARFLSSLALGANPSGMVITEPQAVEPVVYRQAPAGGVVPGHTGGGEPRPGGGGETLKLAPRPGEQAPATGPFKSADVARKAVIVYKPEPGYTEEARQGNVSGAIRLRAVLSSTGKVTGIVVVNGLPNGLTEKAVRAARHMLFFPAWKDGHDVSQYIVLEYNFSIY